MMAKKQYKILAIPADNWEELDEILARAGYKTGAGFGSQRGQGVMELLRRADAVSRAAKMNGFEYREFLAESDNRILEQLEGNE